jgi:FAD:protein FMN transferase
MKKLLLYPALFIILFFIGYKIAVDSLKPEKINRSRILMGTVVDIQVRGEDADIALAAMEEAFGEINRIEKLFSSKDREGGVYQLNISSDSVLSAEEDLFRLLQYSDNLWNLTKGAFDVTLEEIIDLWNFENDPSLPSEAELRKAMVHTGWDKVEFANGELKRNNVKLNFSAIAKGYAVDRAVEVLKRYGLKDALVDAGGEIKTTGGDWKIGIQNPDNSGNILYVLDLKGLSVATSGDYEQYFEVDGIKYHHIIDPSTGYPGRKCKSVTILSGENYFADGLATGVFIMGAEDGIDLIEKIEGTEVLVIDSQGKTWMSSGFNNYLVR